MKNLVNYPTKSVFDDDKNILDSYEDYAALVVDENNIYLKKESYFIVTVNGGVLTQ